MPHVTVKEVDGALRVSTSRLRVLVPLGAAVRLALLTPVSDFKGLAFYYL